MQIYISNKQECVCVCTCLSEHECVYEHQCDAEYLWQCPNRLVHQYVCVPGLCVIFNPIGAASYWHVCPSPTIHRNDQVRNVNIEYNI